MKLGWLVRRAEEEFRKRGKVIELMATLVQGLLYLAFAVLAILAVVSVAIATQLLIEKFLSMSCCSIEFP